MSKVVEISPRKVRLVVKSRETDEFVCLIEASSFDDAMENVPSGPYYVSHQNDPDWNIV